MNSYVVPFYNIGDLKSKKEAIKKINSQSNPKTIYKNIEKLDFNNAIYEKISDNDILDDIATDHLFSGIINQSNEPLHLRLEKYYSLKKKNNPFRKCYKKCIYRNINTTRNNLTKRKRKNNRKTFRKKKSKSKSKSKSKTKSKSRSNNAD